MTLDPLPAPEIELLRISEVATKLRVSPDTVERMANRGELAYIRVGRQKRIPTSALATFIKANHHPASA